MGTIRSPLPAKFFVGMLSPDPPLFIACADILCREYGPLDYQSPLLPWDKTDYYREEMGDGIVRTFIFFERLMDMAMLPNIKHRTNDIERDFTTPIGDIFKRRINLDPGYITEAKVVLASTKDFAHRVYVGSSIYAEVTLKYSSKDQTFVPCDHTYPDYGSKEYRAVFNQARAQLRSTLRSPGQK